MIQANLATNWPLFGRYDLAVIGAGPAGFGAAVAAARRGLKVVLLESYGFAGGAATLSCTPLYFGFGVDGRQSTAGLSDELVRRMDELGAASLILDGGCAMPEFRPIDGRALTCKVQMQPEVLKLLFRRMLAEAGVECLFYAPVVDAFVRDGRVEGMLVSLFEGAARIEAAQFIDCTGDALFCHAANPACVQKYDEAHSMHKSMFFFVGGVTPFQHEYNCARYRRLYEEGRVPADVWNHFGYSVQLNPGVVQIAICFTSGDGVSSADMTRMDGLLRENVFRVLDFLRREMPGFERCYLLDTALKVGVRAGQAILGRDSVTAQTIHGGSCAEPVALTSQSYGGHSNVKGEFTAAWARSERGMGMVPMGALVPRGLENVLAAGRCIASEPELIGTFRMMNTCMTLGEAAGLMAYAARSRGTDASRVTYAALHPLLRENGFLLDPNLA